MITHYKIEVFWNTEYQNLDYVNESFNDTKLLDQWTQQGYSNRFTGDMCDMRNRQPVWNSQFVNFFADRGWKDIGTSYYRMNTGTVLPTHGDLYKRYVELFDLYGRESSIHRAIIFLQDWRPGHYAEYEGQPFVKWSAGDVVEWTYDTPHMAANLGLDPRYTLQVTGWA
jgi:hypothetical protein